MRELILEIKDILKIPEADLKIRCNLFEDNKGAEELTKVPKIRPRTKHIATKYHHFRESVKNKTLLVKRVETSHQLADIFTKALPKQSLEYLRHQIMGWTAILSHGHLETNTFSNMTDKCLGFRSTNQSPKSKDNK